MTWEIKKRRKKIHPHTCFSTFFVDVDATGIISTFVCSSDKGDEVNIELYLFVME